MQLELAISGPQVAELKTKPEELVNPFNAEATVIQSTRVQSFVKTI